MSVHLLCFPQWQGSENPRHFAGGKFAAATVERRLRATATVIQCSDVSVTEEQQASLSTLVQDDADLAAASTGRPSTTLCTPCIDSSMVHRIDAIIRQAESAREQLQLVSATSIFCSGGDCGVEVLPVSYINQRWPGVAVVWFDAHADLNSPSSSPSGHFHGMPVRTLLGEGPAEFHPLLLSPPLQPSQFIYVGARDLDAPEIAYIDAHAMPLLAPHPEATLSSRLELALHGARVAYIHVDLDVLDPSAFPHTCCPTPGGLSLDALLDAIATIGRSTAVVGCGLTECCGDPSSHVFALGAVVDALVDALISPLGTEAVGRPDALISPLGTEAVGRPASHELLPTTTPSESGRRCTVRAFTRDSDAALYAACTALRASTLWGPQPIPGSIQRSPPQGSAEAYSVADGEATFFAALPSPDVTTDAQASSGPAVFGTAMLHDGRLRQLAVHAQSRACGVGSILVEAVANAARSGGFDGLRVNAWLSSQPFYERCGFVAVGDRYVSNGLPCQRMVLDLSIPRNGEV